MMRITRIEPVTKTKYRVSVDEQFAFVVYKGELSRFHLKEECELTEDTYAKIKEVLLKRAKLRAMHLLNDMARTESQLRDKLKLGGYPSEITEAAITYVKSFGYINDDAYIRNFIDSRKDKKSRREIYALLRQKGVDMNRAEEIMEEMYEEHSDQEAIREAFVQASERNLTVEFRKKYRNNAGQQDLIRLNIFEEMNIPVEYDDK